MTSPASDRIEPDLQTHLRNFFQTLSEKDQRRFAALEARRLGHGGITCVAKVLGCCTRTVSRGLEDLDALPEDPAAGRVRRPGAGRKKRSRLTPISSET